MACSSSTGSGFTKASAAAARALGSGLEEGTSTAGVVSQGEDSLEKMSGGGLDAVESGEAGSVVGVDGGDGAERGTSHV